MHEATHKHIADIITALGLNYLKEAGQPIGANTYAGLIVNVIADASTTSYTSAEKNSSFTQQYLFAGVEDNVLIFTRRLGLKPDATADKLVPWEKTSLTSNVRTIVKEHLEDTITHVGWRNVTIEFPDVRPLTSKVAVALTATNGVANLSKVY